MGVAPKIIENGRKLDKIVFIAHGSHGYCTDCFLIKTEALSQLQEVVV